MATHDLPNYPAALDDDQSLYLVADAVRFPLVEDYRPGDLEIAVGGRADDRLHLRVPPTGIITLTDQVDEIDLRAISFHYGSFDADRLTFGALTRLEGFQDLPKAKGHANVVLNVVAQHHNAVKNAVLEVQKVAGILDTVDPAPFGSTVEGRLNHIRRLAYQPRAWFNIVATNRIGRPPFTASFIDTSYRVKSFDHLITWTFGDGQTATQEVAAGSRAETIEHIYTSPGRYDVTMGISNAFGSDSVTFRSAIEVRAEAPRNANITLLARSAGQIVSAGGEDPVFDRLGTAGNAFYTPPATVRTRTDRAFRVEIPEGNVATGRSHAGEDTSEGYAADPVQSFTWSADDDLPHAASRGTDLSYSVGGIYDLKVRVDTEGGSWRITSMEDVIDVIEPRNLWLMTENEAGEMVPYEMGLISETFKVSASSVSLSRSDAFIGTKSWNSDAKVRAQREFRFNTGFARMGGDSGDRGRGLLAWATGETNVATLSYEPFSETYTSPGISLGRRWNWTLFDAEGRAFVALGGGPALAATNEVSRQVTEVALPSGSASVSVLEDEHYIGSADVLRHYVTAGYGVDGEPTSGRFGAHRSAWRQGQGYVIRNSSVGQFFRLASFFRTTSTGAAPFSGWERLSDVGGAARSEGQLVNLDAGLFLFANSGDVAAFNGDTAIWESGGPGSSSLAFRSIQDTSSVGFDDEAGALLAASDGASTAYLAFDYSASAFTKFSTTDMTFQSMAGRPAGDLFMMEIF